MPKGDAVDVTIRKDPDGTLHASGKDWEGAEVQMKDGITLQEATRAQIEADVQMDRPPPHVRAQMVPEYRVDMCLSAGKLMHNTFFANHPDLSPESMQWMLEELIAADLYWVSEPMCELLQHAYPTMPVTTLTPDIMPSRTGIVFFAQPLVGIDSRTEGHPVYVQAYVWGPAFFNVEKGTRRDPGTAEDMEDVRERAPSDFVGEGLSMAAWRIFEHWMPLGRTDWPYTTTTEEPFAPPGYTDLQLASIIEDRRILAAFALLSAQNQKIATTTVVDPPRPVQKRLQRRNLPVPKVRLVDIHKTRKAPGEAMTARHVEWTHRWIVKGHWRQQAYGPGRKLRKPVYISAHVKGPDDKPLVEQEVVKVWR